MKTLSSIFSFRSVSARIIAAVVIAVAAIELCFNCYGILLDDSASVGLVFKRRIIESGGCRDAVAIIGSSQTMALDARFLELRHPGTSVYNYAIPNLETSWQYFLELKLLLERNRPNVPELVVLSVPYLNLFAGQYADFDFEAAGKPYCRFVRMFDKGFVSKSLQELDAGGLKELDALYARGLRGFFPSYRMYPNLIRMFKRGWFGGVHIDVNRRSETDLANISFRIKHFRVFERVSANRELIKRLRKSKGQLLFGPDMVVEEGRVLELSLPETGFESALEENLHAVGALVELAREHGIKVVFFNMPMPEIVAGRLMLNGMMAAAVSGLKRLERENGNFVFCEQEDFYHWKSEYFSDTALHLNRNGATRLNDEFAANIFTSLKQS